MKNSNKSAMPQLHMIDGNWQKEPSEEYSGLTKREYAAIKIVSSICVNAGRNGHSFSCEEKIAETAVRITDSLFKELEKTR
ncbi:hypothetical protein EP331_00425 [bacterium]|nr:MAG: hypothetical protein EP331_00425 [bacterium]